MNNTFKFNYYGLNVSLESTDSHFFNLSIKKFSGFNKSSKSQSIVKRNAFVSFKTVDNFSKDRLNVKLSDTISKSEDSQSILIEYYYLGTRHRVYIENKNNLKVQIEYESSIKFTILNLISRGLLKKQLFQNILKEVVEKTFLNLICTESSMECLHASAVEKNGKIILFAGLNGVGKSTLSQYLIENKGYRYFGDNYILIDGFDSYKSPDGARLSRKSLDFLNKKEGDSFGFEKFYIDSKTTSKLNKAKIKAIYLLTRGNKYENIPSSFQLLNEILKMQNIENENVKNSKISFILGNQKMIKIDSKIKFYKLQIHSFNDLETFSNEL